MVRRNEMQNGTRTRRESEGEEKEKVLGKQWKASMGRMEFEHGGAVNRPRGESCRLQHTRRERQHGERECVWEYTDGRRDTEGNTEGLEPDVKSVEEQGDHEHSQRDAASLTRYGALVSGRYSRRGCGWGGIKGAGGQDDGRARG